MLAVAGHYYKFDGISLVTDQIRELIRALGAELVQRGMECPVYLGIGINIRCFLI